MRCCSDGKCDFCTDEPHMIGPSTFEQALDDVLADVRQTMISKQRDYGVGNIAKFGEYGVVVRLSDKIERLINLHNSGNEPSNESLDDTWTDVIGYGIIGKMVRAGNWGLPLQDDTDKPLPYDPPNAALIKAKATKNVLCAPGGGRLMNNAPITGPNHDVSGN